MDNTARNDWHGVRNIFEAALLHPPEDRRAFARALCGDDDALWSEVSSLLHSHESSETFLETPAVLQVIQTEGNQLFAGQRLLQYEIKKLIGSGGMGEVYLARDTQLDRNVAVKLLRGHLVPDVRAGERLVREARAAALLDHPNICPIYEISEVDGFNFIVMQYVVGTTLDDFLIENELVGVTALDLAVQIAEGLAEAHSHGIIHRDIKPANIIVSDKGPVKILDFGLAKFIEAETGPDAASRLESTGGVMGTVPYMSPEQLVGELVDARTDVFSFGSMLFEMLTGVPAFKRENDTATVSAILNQEPDFALVPQELRPLLQRCLAKEPAGRYATAGEIAKAIVAARNNRSVTSSATADLRSYQARQYGYRVTGRNQKPLYSWQSGGDTTVRSTIPEVQVPRPNQSRWRAWLAIAGTICSILALAVAPLIWPPSWSFDPATYVSDRLQVIPGGTFVMGRDDGNDNEKPAHWETVAAFRMDPTEVTNWEFAWFMNKVKYKPADRKNFLAHWVDGYPPRGEELKPVRFVNIYDINEFIKWRSARDGIAYRLPTEQEWEFAARNGSQENLFPWGDAFDTECAVPTVDHAKEPVGARPCPNSWGVSNLIGSVYEWTSSRAWSYQGVGSPMDSPGDESSYMVRGATWVYAPETKAATSMWRKDVPATTRAPHIGFRLVAPSK